ncbi:MAG TPA: LytTR family DNA-binding domain-containing protein [Gemmatimonadaceae bacterium]|nr:LytTR family DNA-binding domain-containing protein [Gemmatimonadaceae bacterium]
MSDGTATTDFPRDPPRPRGDDATPRLGQWWLGPRALVAVATALYAAMAAAQLLAARLLPTGDAARDAMRVRQDVALLAIWALATPAIVRLARRYPPRGDAAARHVALHLAAATAFIVAANAAIRIPLLLPPWSLGRAVVVGDLLRGLARFYPAALVVYAVLLTAAHRAWTGGAESPEVPRGAPPSPPSPPERVVVREWNRVHLVRPDDVEWIEADDNYVVVHAAGRTYKGRGRIGDLASQLDPTRFVRIHRSAIVRTECVREVQPLGKGDLAVILRDGKTLRAARGRRAALEAALGIVRR